MTLRSAFLPFSAKLDENKFLVGKRVRCSLTSANVGGLNGNYKISTLRCQHQKVDHKLTPGPSPAAEGPSRIGPDFPGKPGSAGGGQRSLSFNNTGSKVGFLLTQKDRSRKEANLLRRRLSPFYPDTHTHTNSSVVDLVF